MLKLRTAKGLISSGGLVLVLGTFTACSDSSSERAMSSSLSAGSAAKSGQTLDANAATGDLALTEGRFRCRADGPGGREADLRLENKKGESRFRAKWEINVGEGQVPGTVVDVAINNVRIGGITLEADGSQLEGEIEMRGGKLPKAVLDIKVGTPVLIGALRCNFARD